MVSEPEEIEANLKILRIPLGSRNISITIMMLENYQNEFINMSIKERELYEFTVRNIVNEIIQEENKGIISSLENGRFVILNSFENVSSQGRIREEMLKLLRRIHFCIQKFMNRSAGFVVGKVDSILSIRESYEAAEKSLNNYFFQSKGEILFFDDITFDKKENKELLLSFEEEQALKTAVNEQNEKNTCEIIDEIFSRLKQEQAQRESCIRIFDDLSILASQICRKNNLDIVKINGGSKSIYEQVMKLERMEKCQEYFRNLFGNIADELSVVSGNTKYSTYVQKAVAYMKKHYREAVSLVDVADVLQISPAYLSTLFNQDTGMGFTEYLNQIRLEEAGELLKQGTYKQKEIASMCGFYNYPYFSTLFKKLYGMTPKEYVKKL